MNVATLRLTSHILSLKTRKEVFSASYKYIF
jgi:hypothetical protein